MDGFVAGGAGRQGAAAAAAAAVGCLRAGGQRGEVVTAAGGGGCDRGGVCDGLLDQTSWDGFTLTMGRWGLSLWVVVAEAAAATFCVRLYTCSWNA